MEKIRVLAAMPRGLVRDSFIPPVLAERLEREFSVRWNPLDRNYTEEELAREIGDAQVCLTGWGNAEITERVLAAAPDLRVIAHTGGTVASLVGDAVYDRGIKVLSGNEIYARSVGEGVICYMLAALRDIPKYAACVQNEGWSAPDWQNEGLLDQKVGLIGFGAVARYTAEMLRAFGVELFICSGHMTEAEAAAYGAKKASMEEIFASCKVVSLHMAATPATYHQVDARLLSTLQEGALLVNTARGSVIDEAALAKELRKKRFKAILDVYEQEPLPAESPLRGLDNCILIPHMGGPTLDRRKFVTKALLDECRRVLEKGEASYLEIDRQTARHMTR